MTPNLDDGDVQLYHGDVIDTLRALPAGIAQTCITSPPYWGLRDYGTGEWTGGDDGDCDHQRQSAASRASSTLGPNHDGAGLIARTQGGTYAWGDVCGRCGARRVDSQLGLEATPQAYVERMVAVFREVWRVLRDDGTVWLNLGDSYSGGGGYAPDAPINQKRANGEGWGKFHPASSAVLSAKKGTGKVEGLKPKDLVGIPWRVAFALQADGWYLRSDIVWSKPNPMPESVSDRPTKAHEYLFLLAKGQRKTRVVEFADLSSEPLHLGANLGPKSPDLVAGDFCVRVATAILDRTKVKDDLSLSALDTEVWQQRVTGLSRSAVGHLPIEHWAAVLSARLLGSDVSPKEFMGELESHGIALADRDEFLVADGLPLVALPPGVARYGKTAVAIHDAGEIGEIEFESHTVKHSRPSGCSYFYDADAIREEAEYGRRETKGEWRGGAYVNQHGPQSNSESNGGRNSVTGGDPSAGRNRRSVWTIPTQPFPEAHFATYPEELVRPCILAGTSEKGECVECGAPWMREVEVERPSSDGFDHRFSSKTHPGYRRNDGDGAFGKLSGQEMARRSSRETTGWRASCSCDAPTRAQTVLDPFIGSGTTALVARKHGRRCIGIDLSAEYLGIAARRLQQLSLFSEATGE